MTATAELVRFACVGMPEDVAEWWAEVLEEARAKYGEKVAAQLARSITEGWNGNR